MIRYVHCFETVDEAVSIKRTVPEVAWKSYQELYSFEAVDKVIWIKFPEAPASRLLTE